MLPRVLLVLFAAPTAPLIEAPLDEGWTVGQGTYFSTNDYEDDAGIAAASVKLELRRDDAGYGGSDETVPFDRGFYSTLAMPNEGARWCFRISHINALAQSSPPSTERCFRTDFTRPTSPAYVDAGAIVSTGRVAIDMLPATDVPSGVRAYLLELGPTRAGELYSFPDPELQFPLVAYVGEGTWYGWVHVVDHAYNDNKLDFGSYLIPITVTANPAIDVPEAPRFEGTMVNAYGISLLWDAGWFAVSGVTHVVASFCNLDAGCEWRHASHTIPVGDSPGRWVQVEDEGTFVARIAVVKGGEVGPWSLPSAPVLVDRTPPPVPPGFNATPSASRAGPVSLSWGAVTDGLTGLSMTVIDEKELVSGVTRRHQAPAPAVSLTVTAPGDGRFQFRAASIDRVANQSAWCSPVVVVVDGTGPVSSPPVARAVATDGGALVAITWSLPGDALSAVASEELLEAELDGGRQTFVVTGLASSRLVSQGSWRWSLRATDSLGNVGGFSAPSNVILVTANGVTVGPSIDTNTVSARCGEPLAVDLTGSGDAPLSWSLVMGPPGLAVDSAGHLAWTPPLGNAVRESATVRLTNAVASVDGLVAIPVSCSEDGGTSTMPKPKALWVGCGCSSLEAMSVIALLALLSRRRRV